jgi:2'-5' RNA ligase
MPRTRTFLALDVGKKVRARLAALQEKLAAAVPDVNWVEEENLHLTLLFLGEVDDRELPAVCRAAQKAVGALPAFPFTVAGAGCFPNVRRPRVLWVGAGLGTDEVVQVHDALEGPLYDLGCYRREERKYTPHITLGRLKGDLPDGAFGPVLAKYEEWSAGEVPVHEVHVMGSYLTGEGPRYSIIGRAKLA